MDLDINLQIRTQRTPNPNAWKYVLSQVVKEEGKVSYSDPEQCPHVPLAAAILRLANVTQVHFFENVLTVTQNGASDWRVLDETLQDILQREVPLHHADFPAEVFKERDLSLLSPDLQRIEEILERTVRPGLRADGGDLEVVELDGNILTIRYEGACGGCPSSMMGTLQAIESILRHEFSPDLEIVAI